MNTTSSVFYFLMLVPLCFLTYWVWYLQGPPPFPVLQKMPATVLLSDGSFWLQQLQTVNEQTADQRVEALSAIMKFQLEERLETADCSKLTLSCGHYDPCGLACQLHHRAFCVMMSFKLGMPLIHDTSKWPFKNPYEMYFKRLGSSCNVNHKTVFLVFSYEEDPYLRFSKLCAGNTCVQNHTVSLSLNEGIPISRELFDLLEKLGHKNPFLWYVGQFILYCLRFSNESAETFRKLENNIKIDLNPPVVGIQARRTDKIAESAGTYRNESEYMEIAGKYFQNLEQHVGPKTLFIASDDHSVLPTIKNRYALTEWKILGFESNVTLQNQDERASDYGLLSIVRDVYFLTKSDFLICGLSSNVCRLILETMATRFYDPDSRCHSVDGSYGWILWHLEIWKLSPV